MNTIIIMTILTFVTTIATYISLCRMLEFDFTNKKWYKNTEKILWSIVPFIWIIDAIVLKHYFTSKFVAAAQWLIQFGLNAAAVILPLTALAVWVGVKMLIEMKRDKIQY